MTELQNIQKRIHDLNMISCINRRIGNTEAARKAETWCVTLMLIESVILRKTNA